MKLKHGLKKSFNFILIIFIFYLFISNKIMSIESAALKMGLIECVGVIKELNNNSLIDNKKKISFINIELKLSEEIGPEQFKKYENIGRNRIKKTNLKDQTKINDILLGCQNLKYHFH